MPLKSINQIATDSSRCLDNSLNISILSPYKSLNSFLQHIALSHYWKSWNKQVWTKFYQKLGKTDSETFEMLKEP